MSPPKKNERGGGGLRFGGLGLVGLGLGLFVVVGVFNIERSMIRNMTMDCDFLVWDTKMGSNLDGWVIEMECRL